MKLVKRKLFPGMIAGFLLLACLTMFSSADVYAAASDIHSIDIDVTLLEDGSADITEVWDITMTSGTEWYLVQGNLGQIEIQDFTVTDETGLTYELVDSWDVNASLEEKAGKCGIIDKGNDSYELCFGIGSYGNHQFRVSYRMTNFVKGFDDYCGFNHRFINDKLSSLVDHFTVTIVKPGTSFNTENTKVWAFGHDGSIHVADGSVYAQSNSALVSSDYVNIMCRFPREMFTPTNLIHASFLNMQDTAMQGSEYEGYYQKQGHISLQPSQFFFYLSLVLVAGLLLLILIILFLSSCIKASHSAPATFEESSQLVSKWTQRGLFKRPSFWIIAVTLLLFTRFIGILIIIVLIVKSRKESYIPSVESGPAYLPAQLQAEAKSNPAYYRDIPLRGDIPAIYTALSIAGITDVKSNILGTYLLKWLQQGNIQISEQQKTDRKGALVAAAPSIILRTLPASPEELEQKLYQMLLKASGDDHILQKSEIFQWAQKNYSTYAAWLDEVDAAGKHSLSLSHFLGHIYQPSFFHTSLVKKDAFTEAGRLEFLHLCGFRNYLSDFTLMQEREPVEVALWDEYLITAQLFGMADQVADTFQRLNPYHFRNTCYDYDYDNIDSTFLIINTFSHASVSGMQSGASAASGGGGSSSSGGGGGHSGGGSGGGGR